jgi:hypothetical protein
MGSVWSCFGTDPDDGFVSLSGGSVDEPILDIEDPVGHT